MISRLLERLHIYGWHFTLNCKTVKKECNYCTAYCHPLVWNGGHRFPGHPNIQNQFFGLCHIFWQMKPSLLCMNNAFWGQWCTLEALQSGHYKCCIFNSLKHAVLGLLLNQRKQGNEIGGLQLSFHKKRRNKGKENSKRPAAVFLALLLAHIIIIHCWFLHWKNKKYIFLSHFGWKWESLGCYILLSLTAEVLFLLHMSAHKTAEVT